MYHFQFRERLFTLIISLVASLPLLSVPAEAGTCPDVKDAKAFFDTVRARVHKSIAPDELESYKCIFSYWNELELEDKRWLSYAMATAWHEARMKPLREGSGDHAKAVRAAKWAYDKGLTKRAYHIPDRISGQVYYGRGLVQLTWAENYQRLGEELGMGDALWRNPDLVMEPDIAAKVMLQGMLKGLFCNESQKSIMQKCGAPPRPYVPSKLGLYFNNQCAEWYRARRMINGDLAKTANNIAGYAKNYLAGLGTVPVPVVAGPGDVIPTEQPKPDEAPYQPPEPEINPVMPGESETPAGPDAGVPATPSDASGTPAATPGEQPLTDINPEPFDTAGGATPATGSATAETPTTSDKPLPTVDADVKQVVAELPGTLPAAVISDEVSGANETPKSGDVLADNILPAADKGGTIVTAETGTATASAADTAAPVAGVDAAVLARIESAARAQQAEIDALKSTLATQQGGLGENRAAITETRQAVDENRRTLAEINERLQQVGAHIETLSRQVEALKEDAVLGNRVLQSRESAGTGDKPRAEKSIEPPGTGDMPQAEKSIEAPATGDSPAKPGEPKVTAKEQPKGWFDNTVNSVRDYIWQWGR